MSEVVNKGNDKVNNEGAPDIHEDTNQEKPSLGRAIWNGTKWFVSKTWKFVVGGIAAIGIERAIEHFNGDDESEDTTTEETPAE